VAPKIQSHSTVWNFLIRHYHNSATNQMMALCCISL